MKKSDAQLLISAIGRAFRKQFETIKAAVQQVSERQTSFEASTDERLKAQPTLEDIIEAVRKTIQIPTAKEIAAEIPVPAAPQIPSVAEIAEEVMKRIAVPTAKEVAAEVQVPEVVPPPSVDEVADAVMKRIEIPPVPSLTEIADELRKSIQIPTAKEIAAEVPAPTLPEIVPPPTVDEVADAVMKRIELPQVPTAQEVAAHVPAPVVPSAEEVADVVKHHMPSVDQLVALVLEGVKVPTAKEIAAEIPPIDPPVVPTLAEVVEQVMRDLPINAICNKVHEGITLPEVVSPPSVDEVADAVMKRIEIPPVPSLTEIADEVRKSIQIPTAKEIAAEVPAPTLPEIVPPPTVDEVADAVMKRITLPEVPTHDAIVEAIKTLLPAMIQQSVDKIPAPVVPTLDEITNNVIETANFPTAKEIAAEIPAPVIPAVPSVDEVADAVMKRITVPQAPSIEDVASEVMKTIQVPTAQEIASHVPVPEVPAVPTVDEILDQIKKLIPEPIKGDKGDSITIDDVRPMIEELIKSLPTPKNGEDGEDGEDGHSVTLDDVRPIIESNLAKWELEFERRAADRLELAIRSIEKPQNGKDGLGFDDLRNLKSEQVGDRIIKLFVMRGEERIDLCEIKLAHPLHKGVFSEDKTYDRGDAVTRDGCTWIALKDSPSGIPGSSSDWQLSVKKGRDGRDARDPSPPPSPRVRVAPRSKGEG